MVRVEPFVESMVGGLAICPDHLRSQKLPAVELLKPPRCRGGIVASGAEDEIAARRGDLAIGVSQSIENLLLCAAVAPRGRPLDFAAEISHSLSSHCSSVSSLGSGLRAAASRFHSFRAEERTASRRDGTYDKTTLIRSPAQSS
jgi:hypothetical protein